MNKRNLKDSKGMLIAGIFSSQTVDSSGEIVETLGLDVTSMEEGKAVCNYEHLSASDGVGKEVIGTVVYVHKVFTYSDCEDDIQKKFFKENREKPYLFGIVRLFDAAGHKEAGAIAAFVRDSVKHGDPLTLQFSIEGSTVTKEGNVIKESIARRVAATLQAANKNCSSKLIADPNAPDGYDKVDHIDELAKKEAFINELAKKEVFIDPMYRKIGSFSSVAPVLLNEQVDPLKRLVKNIAIIKSLKKAMTAGCGDVAPSALTGGAALQKEDLDHKVYSGTILAAARDYDWDNGRKEFKKYLKSRLDKAQLPEVSDQFLDHFTDIAEAVKLKKSVDDCAFADLQKKEKPVLSAPDESVIEDDRTNIPATPTVLTFRGKKLRANPTQKGISLDTKKGILRTPYGTLKLHNPATEAPEIAQHFQDCLNSPHTHKIMSQALKGWHAVHKLAKAGELPEEIPMTATILSSCSGNRPVPLTELQTVRIVDAMRNSGIDVRKPGFEHILPHLRQLDKPDVLPDTGKESVRDNPAYFKQSGELRSIAPLLEDTVKNLSQYYKAHAGLVDLVHRHGTDMASGIRELMDSKNKRTNWNNRRASIVKEKGTDPGEYKGFNIPGIKLKTGLYAYGMMGGSNSVVPDTHFIRHMFGLDTKKDSNTLSYLKNALWNPSNYHVIESYNKWYRDNHPAHKWMVNHPEFGKMFDKPEDATFPAFWANWMNVPAYEEKLGTSSKKQAHNQGSTHAPYWAAIEPHVNAALNRLGKSEDFDTVMPLRAALIMQHYVKDYGEIPAQMLYYTYLVPKLLECAKHRQTHSDATSFLKKAVLLEQELLELRKDIRHVTEEGHSIEMPEVYKVEINSNGKLHPAGRFMTSKGKLYHLEDNHGILNSLLPEGDIDANTISKIHGLMTSPHLEVSEHPLKAEELPKANAPSIPHVVTKLPEPTRPGVFSYFRSGMQKPHIVEFTPHGAALDGKSLSHDELTLMLQNARNGVAKIKWGVDGSLVKGEATEDLMNADEALQHVRAAVQAGHLHPSIERALTKHIFEDSMVGNIGNKYAATQFRKQGRPGVYASIDANDFKLINDRHGHDAGDSAIMALGGAIKNASEKVGTVKTFRPGGDEFFVYAPTHDDMSQYMRHVRDHISALPPIAGVHKQSISVGIGENFAKADEALGIAKQGKMDPVSKQRLHTPGQTPNLGHSLYPGHEGPIFKEETKPSDMAIGG